MLKPSFALDFEDFDALRQLIHQQSGIWLGERKLIFLQIRLADRLQAHNISSPREYYYYLKYDAAGSAEIQNLIDTITINETWFFRELGPLQAWCKVVLPKLIASNQLIRLGSVGCATGEEPYTLVMLLLHLFPTILNKQIDVLAVDINKSVLKAARNGIYDMYSLRRTEDYWLKKFFQPTDKGQYKIQSKVQDSVQFKYGNLMRPNLTLDMISMDVILCRNVMIYLSDASREVALTTIYNALKPGGHLILGHSESLIRTLTPFEVVRVGDMIMYRKPLG